jgi:hypothetical protein
MPTPAASCCHLGLLASRRDTRTADTDCVLPRPLSKMGSRLHSGGGCELSACYHRDTNLRVIAPLMERQSMVLTISIATAGILALASFEIWVFWKLGTYNDRRRVRRADTDLDCDRERRTRAGGSKQPAERTQCEAELRRSAIPQDRGVRRFRLSVIAEACVWRGAQSTCGVNWHRRLG